MSTVRLKKGFDINLLGGIEGTDVAFTSPARSVAVVPDDFHGIIPRMEKKEGEHVTAGEPLYHDKNYEDIKVVSPVSGTVKEVRRGERRHIEAIVITPEGSNDAVSHDIKGDAMQVLLASGLWVMLRQRPYDIVPVPGVRPRDVFVTAFDSAPLAPDLDVVLGNRREYISKGVEVLNGLTDGKVYIGVRDGQNIEAPGAEVNTFVGPHPAGNAGVQAANLDPVNKGETVWTLDIVTLARIGELFTTGKVGHDTVVAVNGEQVKAPRYVQTVMGAELTTLLKDQLKEDACESRIISGNVLTGVKVEPEGWLRAPYRHVTVIPENSHPDEFMGWASIAPSRFSIYHTFTTWLRGLKRPVSMDSRIKGGERAIVRTGEYDAMLPMDIYAEFLIKAIISGDIDKMEQLGVYEIAPEDFALAEFADTSKLELQRIVREGLDKLRAEMS
ncbi:MAG: Na(+)-translocating NADH-quinone reductase subunit A [Muribaculaceae bacterium]|nr:Na(+)-translocating NADH-quinone reductase subunit A [Muribaculaceae bacterium]